MRIDIVNSSGIITGDGKTVLENTSMIIKDCFIDDLPRVSYIPYNAYADKVIDAKGGYVIPGIINIHAHGVCFGPFFPYPWPPLSMMRLLSNLNNHLLQGTTTLLNNDGFSLPAEVEAINKLSPINIKTCTLHTPKNICAAEVTIGHRIEKLNRRFNAEDAVAEGAVAVGEVGSPGTSYGTYEKSMKIGKVIHGQQAKALDNAVISGDEAAIRKALNALGLEKMTISEGKKLVEETTLRPVEACCDAIRESVSYVRKLGVPVIAHAEPGTRQALLDAAKELGPKLIAVHLNHFFTPKESIRLAKELKKLSAIVEVITADFFSSRQVEVSPEATFAMLKEGLVDVITTDYSAGYHGPILFFLQKAIKEGIITLPRAIQLVTSAPARIVPLVAPNKGLFELGQVADLCIVDRDDISKVNCVIIAGRVVVEDGKIIV